MCVCRKKNPRRPVGGATQSGTVGLLVAAVAAWAIRSKTTPAPKLHTHIHTHRGRVSSGSLYSKESARQIYRRTYGHFVFFLSPPPLSVFVWNVSSLSLVPPPPSYSPPPLLILHCWRGQDPKKKKNLKKKDHIWSTLPRCGCYHDDYISHIYTCVCVCCMLRVWEVQGVGWLACFAARLLPAESTQKTSCCVLISLQGFFFFFTMYVPSVLR